MGADTRPQTPLHKWQQAADAFGLCWAQPADLAIMPPSLSGFLQNMSSALGELGLTLFALSYALHPLKNYQQKQF